MNVRRAVQTIRRLAAGVPFWPGARSTAAPEAGTAAELSRVNAVAGTEPIRPALSGLRLRPAGTPRPLARLLIQIGYCWQPSREYLRRQAEIHRMNLWQRRRSRTPVVPPPVLTYVEDTDVSPTRVTPPFYGRERAKRWSQRLPMDLSDLEEVARLHQPRVIAPRVREADPGPLLSYRPLLPGSYRRFLRDSPYPRMAMSLALAMTVAMGAVWMTRLEHAEALAQNQVHVVRHAFRSALDLARDYGVDPRALRPLDARSHELDMVSPPGGLLLGGSQLRFYHQEEWNYEALLHVLRRLERQSLRSWTWKESVTYRALVRAIGEVDSLGMRIGPPRAPHCRTPKCYQAAVAVQESRASWLRETAATLRVYRTAIAASVDPAAAAGNEVQMATALRAIPRASTSTPVRLADLEAMYATATTPAGYARAGALARLSVDALRAALPHTLASRAVVVSVEDQELTCYGKGKPVYRSPVTAFPSTPTGIFRIRAKQASLYGNPSTSFSRYRGGLLTDWMLFSGQAALQGAPWRGFFGPGSDTVEPRYAPSTPGSVDLPPAAAAFVFGWAPLGTEVVIY